MDQQGTRIVPGTGGARGAEPWNATGEGDLARALGIASALLTVLLLVAVVVSPGSLVIRFSTGDEPVAVASAEPSQASTAPAGSQAAPPRPEPSPPAPDTPAVVLAAFEELMDVRDTAVATDDADAWRRTDDTLADAADTGFTVLSSLPVTRFESSVVADTVSPVDGDPDLWQARVETLYELADGPAVVRSDTVQVSHPDPAAGTGVGGAADGWVVESWTPYPEQGELGTVAPWELGPVSAVAGERAVVLAWGEDAQTWATSVLGWSDDGAVVVDSYLGTGWPRVSLVLAPATTEQFDALVPGPAPEADDVFAAVTTDVDTPDGGGDVVIVNPTARVDLVEETWQVTITHELVHVASGALYGDSQEIWLAEGFADLVGWSRIVPSVADRERIAGRLLDRVADGTADLTALPDDDDFSAPDPEVVGDAYEGAWLAALLLEDQVGTDGLIALYGTASEGDGPAQDKTDRALQEATGETREQFEDRWAAYVTDLATG